jgi:hypothetical protein
VQTILLSLNKNFMAPGSVRRKISSANFFVSRLAQHSTHHQTAKHTYAEREKKISEARNKKTRDKGHPFKASRGQLLVSA